MSLVGPSEWISKQNITHTQCLNTTNLDLATFYCGTVKRTKGGALWVFLVKLLPNDMTVCFNHADSFELNHFHQHFRLIFWLKVNNDTVFEAGILEYDRYEPRLGARSCHRYLEFWQDLQISICYVNHVLLVILRLMGTYKNVFKILIVQIRCWGRTLHLTKDMNDQMVDSHFQVKRESWHFCQKTKHIQICSLRVPPYLKIPTYW